MADRSRSHSAAKHAGPMPSLALGAFWLGDAFIDPAAQSVRVGGQQARLSQRALQLLLALKASPGEVISRAHLREALGNGQPLSDGTLTHLMTELRHALGDDPQHGRYIETCPGQGYRLKETALASKGHGLVTGGGWRELATLGAELRSSRVIQVSAGFFIVAWLLLQVAAVVFPMLDLPAVAYKVVVLLLTLTLPILLYVTWARELRARRQQVRQGVTPEIKRTLRRRSGAEAGAILLLSLAALGIGAHVFYGLNQPEAAPSPRIAVPAHSVAVLPFVKRTDVALPNYFVEGIQGDLITSLSATGQLKVASMRATQDVSTSASLSALRERLRVRYVIEGAVSRQGEALLVQVHISSTEDGYQNWQQSFTGRDDELLELAQRLSRQLWLAMGILLPELDQSEPVLTYTRDVTAYDHYLQARALMRDTPTEGALQEAESLLLQALERDPEFAIASAALCEDYLRLYIKTKASEQFDAAQRACEHASDFPLNHLDALATLGQLQRLAGDLPGAERYYRQVLAEQPDHADALVGIAALAARRGDLVTAEHHYQRALAAEPGYWRHYHLYGVHLFGVGDYAEAAAQFRRVTLLQPAYGPAFNNLGGALLLEGDLDGAIEAWRQALEVAPTASTYSNLGSVYFFSGLFPEAVAMYDLALAMRPMDYTYHANRADALKRIPGEGGASQAGFREALALAAENERINPSDETLLVQMARYQAELGACDKSTIYQARAMASPSDDPYVYYDLALAQIPCGQPEDVMRFIRRALELGYPWALLDKDPQFEPYRAHIDRLQPTL
ncbi:tetratricopeptide repeat protein [Ferrimonas balearica]|uniref:tetratricopeptide repeat protein n=1 Tax=Ferrimonas balearica TaxID=44012 RepID=UPI001C994B5D|nr:tetratricopeptide repeat protein [Ferrimonas balearica]MBY5994181.1 tetratricopeptide repeat protein [Ferrimonas balearica]